MRDEVDSTGNESGFTSTNQESSDVKASSAGHECLEKTDKTLWSKEQVQLADRCETLRNLVVTVPIAAS